MCVIFRLTPAQGNLKGGTRRLYLLVQCFPLSELACFLVEAEMGLGGRSTAVLCFPWAQPTSPYHHSFQCVFFPPSYMIIRDDGSEKCAPWHLWYPACILALRDIPLLLKYISQGVQQCSVTWLLPASSSISITVMLLSECTQKTLFEGMLFVPLNFLGEKKKSCCFMIQVLAV